jgi:leader peptidase (prepilin peptidase) / N-methyltransferase
MKARDFSVAALIAPFVGILVGAAIADIRKGIVPNRLVLPAIAGFAALLGILNLLGLGVEIVSSLSGLGLFGGSLAALSLWKPDGLGMGDAKLAALIGLVVGSLGLRYVELAAFAAFALGSVWAVARMAFTRAGRQRKLRFAPFLAAGGMIACGLAALVRVSR